VPSALQAAAEAAVKVAWTEESIDAACHKITCGTRVDGIIIEAVPSVAFLVRWLPRLTALHIPLTVVGVLERADVFSLGHLG
jgi:hypothetical protein